MNRENDLMAYYLGKSGKITGPFDEREIDEMRRDGRLAAFAWIWAEGTAGWAPLDPPPPLPMRAGAGAAEPLAIPPAYVGAPSERERAPEPAPQQQRPRPAAALPERRAPSYYPCEVEALCHDFRSVVTGRLSRVTDQGCELVTGERATSPALVARAPAMLNLLDPASGRTANVRVRVGSACRREGQWVYAVRWSECPALIADAA